MKICLFNPAFDQDLDKIERVQEAYWHVFHLAAALGDLGHDLLLMQAFASESELALGRVRACTVPAAAHIRVGNATTVEVSDYAASVRRIQQFDPDVLHLFGVALLNPLRAFGDWSARSGRTFSVSYHGGAPRRNPLLRWRQKRACKNINAAFFSAREFADQWRGLMPANTQLALAAELSSPFAGKPKNDARATLQIEGHPVFAWCGRLHPQKDPLTVIRGFEAILAFAPNATLLLAYQTAELLEEIQAFLREKSGLANRVRLLGMLPHRDVETLFSAADYYVSSSQREIGGNALVEAMSCGCVPLVADIPSFRQLTRSIEPARYFPVGDAMGFADVAKKAMAANIEMESAAVLRAYERNLSYAALARTYSEVFTSL
jgi:glycosyltransferase involved in cell wall biosynthesis